MRTLAGALALLAPALAGCLQIEETVTLLADGSGKIHLQVGLQKAMLKFLEQMEGPRRVDAAAVREDLKNPVRLLGNAQGLDSYKPGRFSEDAEWMRNSVTAYFVDVNKVRFLAERGGRGGAPETFAFRMSPGSLTLTNRLSEFYEGFQAGLAKSEETPERRKAILEFARPLLASMRVRFAVVVPGTITGSSGFLSAEGSTASTTIGPDLLIAMSGDPEGETARKIEALAGETKARIDWSETAPDPEQERAFRGELAESKGSGLRPPPLPAPAPAPAPPEKPRSFGDDAAKFTDDEVERLFIDAQLKIAREQIDRGQKDKARETLQGVLKDYPKAKAAQEAKKLLEKLK